MGRLSNTTHERAFGMIQAGAQNNIRLLKVVMFIRAQFQDLLGGIEFSGSIANRQRTTQTN